MTAKNHDDIMGLAFLFREGKETLLKPALFYMIIDNCPSKKFTDSYFNCYFFIFPGSAGFVIFVEIIHPTNQKPP